MTGYALPTSDVTMLDGLVVHEARDSGLVHGEALSQPRVLLRVIGPGLVPRASAQEENQRHQDADHADLIKVIIKLVFMFLKVSFDEIFSLMYFLPQGNGKTK